MIEKDKKISYPKVIKLLNSLSFNETLKYAEINVGRLDALKLKEISLETLKETGSTAAMQDRMIKHKAMFSLFDFESLVEEDDEVAANEGPLKDGFDDASNEKSGRNSSGIDHTSITEVTE